MVSVFRIRKHGGRPALALALVTMLLGTSCGGVQPAPATTLAPEDATRMFAALAHDNINILMISTSEIKISCVIDEKYGELAVRTLHDAFGLGNPRDDELAAR